MKEPRANIRIQVTIDNVSPELSFRIGNAITSALQPETRFLTNCEEVRVSARNGAIFVDISASDIQSMRAIVNTFIRLLSLSYMSLNL
ncbi:MAG TPA: KEOPS complex subunit Pcc1 [Nitrososphaeraceae archaeon]|nr:KEOPS complex subunit Pcc1 [Nitrososphaeraceae archaeon]